MEGEWGKRGGELKTVYFEIFTLSEKFHTSYIVFSSYHPSISPATPPKLHYLPHFMIFFNSSLSYFSQCFPYVHGNRFIGEYISQQRSLSKKGDSPFSSSIQFSMLLSSGWSFASSAFIYAWIFTGLILCSSCEGKQKNFELVNVAAFDISRRHLFIKSHP